ncbi:co-chaperone GroES [Helcococcus sueciensis]|uniref:co-chaperone GroES n=1 Tax=Helcococcus sueciensis TaxID=241555 RepID=UPI0003F99D63|nr:co-chaperone GroES [Helcococcus sueciensis]
MKIRPIGKRLVLKTIKKEEKTSSGILMPDSAVEKPVYAEVISVSKEIEDKNIKVGDRVIYTKYKGTEIKDGEEEYILIDIEDVLGVVEG